MALQLTQVKGDGKIQKMQITLKKKRIKFANNYICLLEVMFFILFPLIGAITFPRSSFPTICGYKQF
jgi:hypothetical protein